MLDMCSTGLPLASSMCHSIFFGSATFFCNVQYITCLGVSMFLSCHCLHSFVVCPSLSLNRKRTRESVLICLFGTCLLGRHPSDHLLRVEYGNTTNTHRLTRTFDISSNHFTLREERTKTAAVEFNCSEKWTQALSH